MKCSECKSYLQRQNLVDGEKENETEKSEKGWKFFYIVQHNFN